MKKTIMIVDDTPINRCFLSLCLKSEYNIIEASTGEDAISVAKSKQPDLILLDVLMPGLNGFETAAALKADIKTSAIPIIFVTALNGEEYTSKAKEVGAADFVVRPFSASMIKARIKTIINNRFS